MYYVEYLIHGPYKYVGYVQTIHTHHTSPRPFYTNAVQYHYVYGNMYHIERHVQLETQTVIRFICVESIIQAMAQKIHVKRGQARTYVP